MSTLTAQQPSASTSALTSEQIDLIRTTWAAVEPIQDVASEMFYQRLFRLDPALEPLFAHTDMRTQGRMLMQTLAIVVKSVDHLEQLVPAVRALGSRHAGYGVKSEDYATVGQALLWTLEEGLGDSFTLAARYAWAAAYGLLAAVMIEAAEAVPQAA
jgi:hemoglobin-like flavoprotein